MAPLGASSLAGLMGPLLTGAVRKYDYGSYHLAIILAGVLLSPLSVQLRQQSYLQQMLSFFFFLDAGPLHERVTLFTK
jgi:hypothetical protein